MNISKVIVGLYALIVSYFTFFYMPVKIVGIKVASDNKIPYTFTKGFDFKPIGNVAYNNNWGYEIDLLRYSIIFTGITILFGSIYFITKKQTIKN